MILDPLIDMIKWVYYFILDIIFWIFDGLTFLINDPRLFFRMYGLVIGMIIFLVVSVLYTANWLTKRKPFQPVYMAPSDKPRRGRYLGRKLLFFKQGSFFFKWKLPEDRWDDFDAIMYFFSPKMLWKIPVGGSVDRMLIPSENRTTFKFRGGFKWSKDLYIYFKGHKEYHELAAKIASNENKATTPSVGPDFYTEASEIKLNLADKLAQKGVTSNAESQQYQLALGSVPYDQEFNELTDKEVASMYLKEKEGKDVEPDEIPENKVNSIIKELEVGTT